MSHTSGTARAVVADNQNDVVRCLAERGANVNLQNKLGNTALHYACAFQFEGVAETLDGFGADGGISNAAGELPCQFQGKRFEQPRPPQTARW